ncbi:conserved hypothetical protein [Theileria orientalis strain Shintoku]|uniref:Uncharacterized protein n=1 Tax=Theileria orientalis strain Shintoku TaxID=869250 RepID=J4C8P2_THEOR|nr:conserved hypothetical protein [Theileria orientalis strain Shintoku]BAM41133.1 conserved hypothetical protein [Theileria orientalis strain Shintoku]|eukprot:XP_009691434.1 conserved hypothetical protein [Theileria orientalis strain Shintoku]
MDLDNSDKNTPNMSGSAGELQGTVSPQREYMSPQRESPGFKMPRISMFSRKPRLKPEVIELGPPTEADDPSTSSHLNNITAASTHGNAGGPDMSAQEQENEGVFDTHIAVLYDRYLNMKEAISNKIRDKIMAFMRDELDNDPGEEELDVEGGLAPLRAESTYDRLVLIITILLGFVFKSPLMWIVGSFLFLIYGNFKRKIIKVSKKSDHRVVVMPILGTDQPVPCISKHRVRSSELGIHGPTVSLSQQTDMCILSFARTENNRYIRTFMIKPGGRSILLSRQKHVKLEEGVLSYEGKDAVLLTIEGNKNLKWSIVHDNKEHTLKHGNFSNELLVDSKLIPPSTDMIRLNHEILVKGLVQVSVKFKTAQPTPSQSFEQPKSHYYPLYHKPSVQPYEVSFECHQVEPGAHKIENTGPTYRIDFDEGIDDPGKNKNLKGIRRPRFQPYIQERKENKKVDDMEDESNPENLPVEAFEKEDEDEDESPIKVDPQKEKEEKRYIGVDAVESDVFVTRLFHVNTLAKCSLVHKPKSGTDVVSVYIKRLQ